MIRAILESMMGSWGKGLMDFYDANSLWINILVLLYGAWIVLSWINLKRIRSELIVSLAQQLSKKPNLKTEPLTSEDLARLKVPWEDAVRRARYPFVAYQTALVPRRLSVEAVKSMLTVEDLTGEALRIMQPRAN
jgi:hypothetical protein